MVAVDWRELAIHEQNVDGRDVSDSVEALRRLRLAERSHALFHFIMGLQDIGTPQDAMYVIGLALEEGRLSELFDLPETAFCEPDVEASEQAWRTRRSQNARALQHELLQKWERATVEITEAELERRMRIGPGIEPNGSAPPASESSEGRA